MFQRRDCFAFSALLVSSFLYGSSLPAQMQLPPGTSSAVENGPQSSAVSAEDATIQKAQERMQAQDWKTAVGLLRPVTGPDSRNSAALYNLGFCLEALHDEAGAKDAYMRSAAADGKALAPRVALGLMVARAGDTASAEVALRDAVLLDGDPGVKAQGLRALARLDLQKAPEKARDELVQAIRLTKEMPGDALLTGEIAEVLHDDNTAAQEYAQAIAEDPGDAEARAAYGRMLTREGRMDEAASVLDSGLKEYPENVALLSERAGLLVQQKNFTEAVPLLERLHARNPADSSVTRLLARAYVAQGDTTKADVLFQQALHANPDDGQLMAEWADSLIRQKRNPEAETLLEKAVSAHFDDKSQKARAASELAFAASVNHHPETVLRAILIRNEILPMDATSAFLLATAHDTLHHTSQAVELYQQFLGLANGKFPDEEWQAQGRLKALRSAK